MRQPATPDDDLLSDDGLSEDRRHKVEAGRVGFVVFVALATGLQGGLREKTIGFGRALPAAGGALVINPAGAGNFDVPGVGLFASAFVFQMPQSWPREARP